MSARGRRRKRQRPKVTRDLVLFTVGLGLTVHEAVMRQGERPYLIALYGGMMGLPLVAPRRGGVKGTNDDDEKRSGGS